MRCCKRLGRGYISLFVLWCSRHVPPQYVPKYRDPRVILYDTPLAVNMVFNRISYREDIYFLYTCTNAPKQLGDDGNVFLVNNVENDW